VQFEDEEQARFIILGLGQKARVLEPVTLRNRILADAAAVLNDSVAGNAVARPR
jgi:predicted DNA-binding transcriptional regulator YafY